MAKEAWLILLRAPGIGPAALRGLIAQHGSAERALLHLRGGRPANDLGEDTRRWLDAPDAARIEADLDWLGQPQHHLLGWEDPDFPSLLREIPGAPAALFVVGDASLLWMPQVAMVGSRSASANGIATTRRFSRALAQAGFTVTSGMADGIDAAAHEAALDAGCPTVAVLGTGPDLVYPRKHQALAARIAERGALVSEFPPGTPGKAEHFPRRNRIISGLALGTLVVEAGLKSGSLITARYASEQGREVFAIPGSINNPLARGCHQLIRDGARLTETAEEIIGELSTQAIALADRLRAVLHPRNEHDFGGKDDSSDGARVRDPDYIRLLAAMGHDEIGLDVLGERTGFGIAALSSMLLVLELDGEVCSTRAGTYTRLAAG